MSQECDSTEIFGKVFSVYQSQLEPYLKRFSEEQYLNDGKVDSNDFNLLVQTRFEIYREKTTSLRTKVLAKFKKEKCKSDGEFIGLVSGTLDQLFRYEFPGLDYQFYKNVNSEIAKLINSIPKKK